MVFDGRYKMVNGIELYDLEIDPGETKDIAGEEPDILEQLKQSQYIRPCIVNVDSHDSMSRHHNIVNRYLF